MFNLFRKKAVSNDACLESYEHKDKYFVRVAAWDWLNKKEITVATQRNGKPTMLTMDFWLQEIFLDADGQITVTELMAIARKQLTDSKLKIPDNMCEYLTGELERLVFEMKIVAFRSEKTTPEPRFMLPMSKQR